MKILLISLLVSLLCGCSSFGSKHQMTPKEQQKWLSGAGKR